MSKKFEKEKFVFNRISEIQNLQDSDKTTEIAPETGPARKKLNFGIQKFEFLNI